MTGMLEHLQGHPAGLLHVVAALVAIAVGAFILRSTKGTRVHRWSGRAYLVSMVTMNLTALLNFELYGRFGPFHWMVLASLATLACGYLSARRRAPGWMLRHAYCMGGSYIGLLAAAAAEVASRVPGWPFGPAVLVSSVATILMGLWILLRAVPRAGRPPAAGAG